MIVTKVDVSTLTEDLEGLKEGLSNLGPVYRGPVYNIFKTFIKAHFSSEGGYSGEQWAPLSPTYAAWKAKHYPGRGILQREGRLYNSLSAQSGDTIFRVTPTSAEFGTKVPYAVYHQAEDRGAAPFPRRAVIPPFTRAELTRIKDAILAYLLEKMRNR